MCSCGEQGPSERIICLMKGLNAYALTHFPQLLGQLEIQCFSV